MREKAIEQKLVMEAKRRGGVALKFTSPGTTGVPDRLVLLSGGRMGFVEVKAPGKKPRPLQERRIEQLRKLGYYTAIIDNTNQIDGVLDKIEAIRKIRITPMGGDAL